MVLKTFFSSLSSFDHGHGHEQHQEEIDMSLQLLPTELLTLIGTHLQEPELKQLTLTNRRLHKIFNPLLYQIDKNFHYVPDANDSYEPGIIRAAQRGIVEAVRRFIDFGAKVNIQNARSGWTALHVAAENGHSQVAELLLENGADMELENHFHLSVLGQEHSQHVLEVMLRFKPNLNAVLAYTDNWPYFSRQYAKTLRKYVIPAALVEFSGKWDSFQILLTAALDDDVDDVVAILEWESKTNPEWRLDNLCPLSAAILRENLRMFKAIYEASTTLDRSDPISLEALFFALKCGNLEIARYLIDQGVPLNIPHTPGASSVSPAFGAAASADVAMLDFVLGLDANVLGNGPACDTGLHYALGKVAIIHNDAVAKLEPEGPICRIPMLRRLLELGADVNRQYDGGYSPLNLAIVSRDVEAMEFLLEHGANAHKADGGENIPISVAIEQDFVPGAKLLLQHGASVAIDSRGMTLLNRIASSYQSVDMLKLILDAGADLHAQDADGHTPLINAAFAVPNRLDKMRMLLEYGARVNEEGGCQGAALTHAIAVSNIEATKLLLDHGADIHMFTPDGQNCLHDALNDKNIPMIKLLFEYGADVTQRTKQGRTPLHLAVSTNNPEVVATLLEANTPVNEAIPTLGTPLIFALRTSPYNTEIISLLLQHGASPNVRNRKGTPALHLAVSAGNHEVTTLLLEHGADVNARDRKGRTPLVKAEMLCRGTGRNKQIIRELVSYGSGES